MNVPDKVQQLAAKVRLAIFDVDGVLTNGSLILGDNGDEYKIFHVHDGLGLVMLREAGIKVAVISARSSNVVSKRMADLGIEFIYQGQENKRESLLSLVNRLEIDKAHTAFTGDDLIDLPAMAESGLPIAVANAHPKVIEHAAWVTEKPGGQGAVREICELILKAQGALETAYQRYLDI